MASPRPMIEVTEELIGGAIKADSSHCMIADAIKRAIPAASSVTVDVQCIRYTDKKKGERRIYLTPALCQQQIVRFDQGTEVKPWSFRLPPPAQITKVVAQKNYKSEETMPREKRKGSKDLVLSGGGGVRGTLVRGGAPPPVGALAHSHKGQRRIFGMKTSLGFDPSKPLTE